MPSLMCQVAWLQLIFLVNFMNYWIRTIPFLLILEQALLGCATQGTIKSAAGLFIMHNRIASALFNFQVMIAECLGFSPLPISNASYIFSHTYFLPLSVLTPWILSQVIPSDHIGNLFEPVNSGGGRLSEARAALAAYQACRELHLLNFKMQWSLNSSNIFSLCFPKYSLFSY